MYGYEWTDEYGIFRLTIDAKIQKEIRPVFHEELDFFGMDAYWDYPKDTDAPILWAEGVRRYVMNGVAVAEAQGGGFYTKPVIKLLTEERLKLQPVDTERLYEVNRSLMINLQQKAGLRLLAPNIEAAIARGACGKLITSTYQNFTDIDSLQFFYGLQTRYPDQFSCKLDRECFHDYNGNTVGFHSKGYLFEFEDHAELLVGYSNITVYALLKNVEWDVSVVDEGTSETYSAAKAEFDSLWEQTLPLSQDLINEYKTRLYYSIERWDIPSRRATGEHSSLFEDHTGVRPV